MNKEQEIQEIANIICGADNGNHLSCVECDCYYDRDRYVCPYKKTAEALYAHGYRQADNVRKETLQDWYDYCNEYLKKKYGAEVDK